ncbi:hypothetical protein K1T71_000168 [Dendrolimus kikuchii]|uniref:Uncharacterized protein n=1 Tax=Dendrolimus kikuchii TaxID=765133 RepID=A0ACC1DIX7_9NEOP|nr:hypothetical protein K1T71_000168 [Dendrolimus kikuchii]
MKLFTIIIFVYSYWVMEGLNCTIPDSTMLFDNSSDSGKLFSDWAYPKSGDIPLLNRKVFKGQRVTIKEHPYTVSIRRMYAHYCTGAIISKNIVISVAHPLNNVTISELGIVAGETYADRGTIQHTVLLLIIHEDFDPYTLQADLALLTVYEEIEYRISVKPVSLIAPEFILNKTKAFVTGWGRCDITGKELCLPRTSMFNPNEKLDPMLRSVSFDLVVPNVYCEAYKKKDVHIKPGMMCLGQAREENLVAPCLAVPGAPLVVKSKLAGILSWGFGCGYYYDMPLVYTSIQYYQAWLVHNVPIIRKIKRNNFTRLFHSTRAHVLVEWLKKTRIMTPIIHQQKYKNLEATKLDRELTKLKGFVYDIRDYLNGGMFRAAKKAVYNNIKNKRAMITSKIYVEATTTVFPFIGNDTLAEIGFNISDIYSEDETDRKTVQNTSNNTKEKSV